MSYLKSMTLFGLLLALTIVPAIAQDYRGNIYVNVTTDDGNPIEGASVMAIGQTGTRTAETGADGKVRFSRLDPGYYTLEVSMDGFNTAVYEQVELNTGSNVEMDITMVKTQVVERVVVTSRTPVLDRRKTGTSTVVSPREIEQIPSARDPWAILSTIPGLQADRINVGGNQSGQQSAWAAKGDDGSNASWVLDGVEFTDLAARGGSSTYFDFNSFQEVGFTTGGGALEQTTPGQQLSFVTKQGANRHTGSISLLLADEDFQEDPPTYNQPDGSPFASQRIVEVFEKVFDIGGPIAQDKAWYWVGFSQNDIVLAVPAGGGAEQPDTTKLRNTTVKINGTVQGKTSWKGFYTRGDKIKIGRNASISRPPATTWNQSGPTPIYTADVSHFFTPNIEIQFQASHVGGGFGLKPQGFDLNSQIRWDSNFVWQDTFIDYLTDRPTDQFAIRGNWFTETGNVNHEFRFGFKLKQGEVQSFSRYGSDDVVAVEWASEAWLYRGGSAKEDMDYTTVWFGDTMIWNNWSFNAGVTYQNQSGTQLGSTSVANGICPACLPDLTYNGLDPNFEFDDILYRVGATYTLSTARRQLIRFSAGSYADGMAAGDVAFNHPMGTAEIDYPWTDGLGGNPVDNLVQLGEIDLTTVLFAGNIDPSNPLGTEPVNFISTDLEAPTVDEFILGYEIEIAKDFTLGLNLTSRNRDNTLWAPWVDLTTVPVGFSAGDSTSSIAIVPSSAFTAQSTAVTSTVDCFSGGDCFLPGVGFSDSGVTAYYIGDAAVIGGLVDTARRSILQNRPGYDEDFDSIEFVATKRLSNRWMMRGFVSFQDWTKNIGPSAIQNPSNLAGDTTLSGSDVIAGGATTSGAFGDVFVGTSTWQYNINGMYELPKNFRISANLNGREGYALPYFLRVDQRVTGIGGPLDGLNSRQNLQVGSVTQFRTDDILVLDLGISYLVQLGGDTTVDLGLNIFNLLDDDTILQLERRMGSTSAGRIDEALSPQVFRLSAKITF